MYRMKESVRWEYVSYVCRRKPGPGEVRKQRRIACFKPCGPVASQSVSHHPLRVSQQREKGTGPGEVRSLSRLANLRGGNKDAGFDRHGSEVPQTGRWCNATSTPIVAMRHHRHTGARIAESRGVTGVMRSCVPRLGPLPTDKEHDGLNHTQPWSRIGQATVAQSADLKALDATLRRAVTFAHCLLWSPKCRASGLPSR